jgi:subtilase family protein
MRFRALAWRLAVGAIVLALPASAGAQQLRAQGTVGKQGVGLADGRLRDAVDQLRRGARAPADVDVVGQRVRVEALVAPGRQGEVAAAIAALGGFVEGFAGTTLVQALVPSDRLVALERTEGVRFVRPPLTVNAPQAAAEAEPPGLFEAAALAGEEVVKTRANAWHAAAITGVGVKVGIIDFFDGAKWSAGQASGDLPAPAGTFCREAGTGCDVFDGGDPHGVAVGEVIHEMAPGAQLYLAQAVTTADLQAAVDYFAAQGVSVISRSLTAEYDGPGNGTGPLAQVIDNAVARGITWFNSAGNNASRTPGELGSYWRDSWRDLNNDGWYEFGTGDQLMGFYCGFMNGLRWSDWGASRTDYDLFVYDTLADAQTGGAGPEAVSDDNQPGGAPPLEHVLCDGRDDVDYLAIRLFASGGGTTGDVLEVMVNLGELEYFDNPFSASGPGSDTGSTGALSIGAVDPPLGSVIGEYSSEGPTNDNRIKPDLSAAACVKSTAYAPTCFNGTSAATPVAAGAAALLIASRAATTPAAVKSFLMNSSVVDRGAAGPDPLFGAGELVLPAPPLPEPLREIPIPVRADMSRPRDTQRPFVRAFRSRGRRGKVAKLRYTVRDNSGFTREHVVVGRGRHRLKTIFTAFARARGGRYHVRWRVPKRIRRGRLRFCVSSTDRAQNRAPFSCARLRIR